MNYLDEKIICGGYPPDACGGCDNLQYCFERNRPDEDNNETIENILLDKGDNNYEKT